MITISLQISTLYALWHYGLVAHFEVVGSGGSFALEASISLETNGKKKGERCSANKHCCNSFQTRNSKTDLFLPQLTSFAAYNSRKIARFCIFQAASGVAPARVVRLP